MASTPDTSSPFSRPPAVATKGPGFANGYDAHVRDRYATRTVAEWLSYLLPYLDKLNNNNSSTSTSCTTTAKERPRFTFLDVGCGPGSLTVDFAQRYPEAFFVGVDPGEAFVDAARQRADRLGVGNVVFVVGDVFELAAAVAKVDGQILRDKFGVSSGGGGAGAGAGNNGGSRLEGLFDVVACHQVLTHLAPSQRPLAVRNMYAMAKKKNNDNTTGGGGQGQEEQEEGREGGGIIAAREAEVEALMSVHPETPLLSTWRTLYLGVLRANHLANERAATNSNTGAKSTTSNTHHQQDNSKKYRDLGSTFAGKSLTSTFLTALGHGEEGEGVITRSDLTVTGSLNTHAQHQEKLVWMDSMVPMLEDRSTSWNKKAVEVLGRYGLDGPREGEGDTSLSSTTKEEDGAKAREGRRGMSEEEAVKLMKGIAQAWREWADDETGWMALGSFEIVCRC